MHIPENYLSPSTCAVMAVAALPVVYTCAKRIKHRVPPERVPLLGVGAALSFLLMMFNVPVPGGTSAHAVGGTLIAVLLGPEAAVLAVTAALVIQALFFGDGGLLALGANIFNMAVATEPEVSPEELEVLSDIRKLDINEMTPMEAMVALHRLNKRLKE